MQHDHPGSWPMQHRSLGLVYGATMRWGASGPPFCSGERLQLASSDHAWWPGTWCSARSEDDSACWSGL